MRNLLRFLVQNNFTLLFIILELIAFALLVNYNSFHNARVFKIRHAVVGNFSESFTNLSNYLSLARQNKLLVEENARLYNHLEYYKYDIRDHARYDSVYEGYYKFIPAQVVNLSTNKQQNSITVDKGSLQGIKPEMGVISSNGLVGIVKTVSRHFSTVIPIISRETFNPSASIARTGFYGIIEWPGNNYRNVLLKDIPLHAVINIGDTIQTSGITATFPKGIMIGTVKEYKIESGIKYTIEVELSTDYKNLSQVWVIDNMLKDEQKKLEEGLSND